MSFDLVSKVPEMYVLNLGIKFRVDVLHNCMCANPARTIDNKLDNIIASELVC